MPVKGNRPTARQVEPFIPLVIERLEAGESLNAITTNLGLSRDIAAELVHAQRPGLIQAPRKRLIDPETKRKAVAEYMNGNESFASLGRKYGVVRRTLRRWVYEAEGVYV